MTTLTVDPAEYAAAAAQLARVGVDAAHVVSTLTAALDGSGGMAGSDHAGTAWADGYDQAAKAALEAASTAAAGAGQVATLLHATGQNHAHADAASTIGGGDATLPAPPAPLQPTSPVLPSAAGGIGAGPPGWPLVAGLVGYAWPNGHQDRLHAAQAAWSAAAGAMEQVATPIATAASRVGAQQSPEAPAASSTCTQIGTHIGELAGVFTQVGQSCGEYAAHLDQAHHEIISVLRDLVVQTVAIEAGGAVLAFFTAGLDEIAAQAAVAARVASAAAKIRRVIEALIEAARVVATAIRGYLGKAVEITAKLKSVIGFGVKRAETMAVRGVRAEEKLPPPVKGVGASTRTSGEEIGEFAAEPEARTVSEVLVRSVGDAKDFANEVAKQLPGYVDPSTTQAMVGVANDIPRIAPAPQVHALPDIGGLTPTPIFIGSLVGRAIK
ncbi:hypothetical protein [Speluncibacter jeojiensis]|uniref:Outer membrane channel protein CpnT-like N-terminal domain-containing protein n=1 Tax=Speluncibacter jeojiensis TaxID=2710754 RepID=A0A9X4M553_9ACTN|nr:hypothetical protein [Corynebacteriales bacterium D3-21]